VNVVFLRADQTRRQRLQKKKSSGIITCVAISFFRSVYWQRTHAWIAVKGTPRLTKRAYKANYYRPACPRALFLSRHESRTASRRSNRVGFFARIHFVRKREGTKHPLTTTSTHRVTYSVFVWHVRIFTAGRGDCLTVTHTSRHGRRYSGDVVLHRFRHTVLLRYAMSENRCCPSCRARVRKRRGDGRYLNGTYYVCLVHAIWARVRTAESAGVVEP